MTSSSVAKTSEHQVPRIQPPWWLKVLGHSCPSLKTSFVSGVLPGGFPEASWQHSALYQHPGVTHCLDWGRTACPVLLSLVDAQGMALVFSSSHSWLEPQGSHMAPISCLVRTVQLRVIPSRQPLEPWRGSLPKSYFLWGSKSV